MLAELDNAGASDADIHQITWENSCRYFGYDPFKGIARENATVGEAASAVTRRRHDDQDARGVAPELRGRARGLSPHQELRIS